MYMYTVHVCYMLFCFEDLYQVQPGSYEGIVLRPMKTTEDPQDYEGLIQPTNGSSQISGLPQQLPYSVTSLVDYRISLQEGDPVRKGGREGGKRGGMHRQWMDRLRGMNQNHCF